VSVVRVAAILLSVALLGCLAPPPASPVLPTPTEVRSITATVFGSMSQQPDLAEFEMPAGFVSELLRILSPLEHHQGPPAKSADVVAFIQIQCQDGRKHEIELLSSRSGVVHFNLNGMQYRRVGSYADLDLTHGLHLAEIVQIESFLRAVRQGQANKARAFLERIDRCAGR
jgi:hypothetical protein